MRTRRKLACRVLLGLLFLYPATRLHVEAHYLFVNASGFKPPSDATEWAKQVERQRGMTDEEKRAIRRADPRRRGQALEFFGPEEREAQFERERPVYERAFKIQREAFAIAGIGLAFIGWGLCAALGSIVRAWLPKPGREEACGSSVSS